MISLFHQLFQIIAEALLSCMESKEIHKGEATLEGHEDPEVCACGN